MNRYLAQILHMFEEGGCSLGGEKFSVLRSYIKLGRFLTKTPLDTSLGLGPTSLRSFP